MNTTQREQSQEQSSSEEQPKSNYHYNDNLGIRSIENTPFNIVVDEQGYRIAMGKYVVSKPYLIEEDAIKDIEEKHWNLIIDVILLLVNDAIADEQGLTVEELIMKRMKDKGANARHTIKPVIPGIGK